MDVIFDAVAAQKLLFDMDMYCREVEKARSELMKLGEHSYNWKDDQKTAFQSNIEGVSYDLRCVIQLERDYMKVFEQRIKELKG